MAAVHSHDCSALPVSLLLSVPRIEPDVHEISLHSGMRSSLLVLVVASKFVPWRDIAWVMDL